MIENPLKEKRIAIIGGQGARPEAKNRLIKMLDLSELEWVYSERGSTHAFMNFMDSLYPGKYDYVYVLTKFISHKVLDIVKAGDLGGAKLVRINGSYNPGNFLRALFKQTDVKPVEIPEEQPPIPVVANKGILEPATPDTTEHPRIVAEDAIAGDDQELAEWHKCFGVQSPEAAKAKVDANTRALEAMIARLTANQQDPEVLDAALGYHSAVNKYLNKLPVPFYVGRANDRLVSALKKHNIEPDGGAGITINNKQGFESKVMRTNALLGHMFLSSRLLFKSQANDWVFNPRGACHNCKRHKSVGHAPDCIQHIFKKAIDVVEANLKRANVNIPED